MNEKKLEHPTSWYIYNSHGKITHYNSLVECRENFAKLFEEICSTNSLGNKWIALGFEYRLRDCEPSPLTIGACDMLAMVENNGEIGVRFTNDLLHIENNMIRINAMRILANQFGIKEI